ncbi:MAG: phosphoribosylformylglycinamidine synthase subunit PurL [Calditrichaeota bacterium]|nr:phosphoribosylformylglycinamidine synthase subunit PurL [Calditrichota bacterium]
MLQTPKHDPLKLGTLEEAISQTMNEEEYNRVIEILGRVPNVTELAIFAVMWSEHCSYKNSILELKKLPRSGGLLMTEAGAENAGLVDIGDKLAIAFKIESHNHPSAVEPFQGAATGVGGILRDVFTMGARPIAALNSLRFASLTDPHNRFLLDGVVRGIAHYGNCFGVPTVAGEICFDDLYKGNPLVNAMAVGVVHHDKIATAKASGVGNPVFYVGSRTGRDGTHGATFASAELSEDNESKRSAVQVGDPFSEKLLLEATLELAGSEALVAIQDMGAAGLTCSSCEMAAAGGVGMDLNLDLVPLRQTDIEPWEIMLSESQERMLLIAKKGFEQEILRIFHKWDLEVSEIGKVTDDGMIRLHHQGRVITEVPAWDLVLGGGAPQYAPESKRPDELDEFAAFDPLSLPIPPDHNKTLLKLLGNPEIASKEWIYQQYDHSVRTNTAIEPGRGDASVVRVEGSKKGISVKTDGNARYTRLDPFIGGTRAVAEAALNVACTGAKPVAITNCLNFGNPYKPGVFYFFKNAVAGMGEACRILETPVTGGNVSFHNETDGLPVLPTVVIGMLGLLDDASVNMSSGFKSDGDAVYLLGGASSDGLGGSSYLNFLHNKISGKIDPVDFDQLQKLIDLLVELNTKKLINSAHDVSDGGLAICLAECCLMDRNEKIGVTVDIPNGKNIIAQLFGESPGRVVVSVDHQKATEFEKAVSGMGVLIEKIGETGGDKFIWKEVLDLSLNKLSATYFSAIPDLME